MIKALRHTVYSKITNYSYKTSNVNTSKNYSKKHDNNNFRGCMNVDALELNYEYIKVSVYV